MFPSASLTFAQGDDLGGAGDESPDLSQQRVPEFVVGADMVLGEAARELADIAFELPDGLGDTISCLSRRKLGNCRIDGLSHSAVKTIECGLQKLV
ncbi:hypothetical protein DXU06_07100 [Bradyrhizobium elkanii]|jgi:hypothetical protein|nr:hypothetical protein BEL01nite_16970 [Bradyrhizobium elkanii]